MPKTSHAATWPAWTDERWTVAEEPDEPTTTVEVNGGEAAEADDTDGQDALFDFYPDDEFDD